MVLYYNLVSSEEFRPVACAQQFDSVAQLEQLLEKMRCTEDSVSLYDSHSAVRIMFFYEEKHTYICEISNARNGMVFSRSLGKEDVQNLDLVSLKNYIEDPLSNGFCGEGF